MFLRACRQVKSDPTIKFFESAANMYNPNNPEVYFAESSDSESSGNGSEEESDAFADLQ